MTRLSPKRWVGLALLMLVITWLTTGLIGFLLLEKQKDISHEMMVSSSKLVVHGLEEEVRDYLLARDKNKSSSQLYSFLKKIKYDGLNILSIDVFNGAGFIAESTERKNIEKKQSSETFSANPNPNKPWVSKLESSYYVVSEIIAGPDGKFLGGLSLTVDTSVNNQKLEALRSKFITSVVYCKLANGFVIAIFLFAIWAGILKFRSLQLSVLMFSTGIVIASGTMLSVSAGLGLADLLKPFVERKAVFAADLLQEKIQRSMDRGLTVNEIIGQGSYLTASLKDNQVLSSVRVRQGDDLLFYMGEQEDGVTLLSREIYDRSQNSSTPILLEVQSSIYYYYHLLGAAWADLLVVILVGVVLFREATIFCLGSIAKGKAASSNLVDRLTLVRLPLFLFILTEELTRSFLPLQIQKISINDGQGIGNILLGLPITIYMIFFAIFTPLGGKLADRYGSLLIFGSGAILSALGFLWSALAESLLGFTIARAFCAAGYALATMAVQSTIIAESDQESRAQGLAMFIGAVGIAAICGSSLGGVVAQHVGFEAVFFLSAIVCMLATILYLCIPTIAVGIRGGEQFVWFDLIRLLRNAPFSVLMLGSAIPTKVALAGLLFYLAPLSLAAQNLDPAEIGRLIMVYYIVLVLVTPIAAKLSDKYCLRKIFVVAGGLVLGIGLFAGILGGEMGFVLFIIGLGIGAGVSSAALQALSTEAVSVTVQISHTATIAGLRTIERLGSASGPLLVTCLFSWGGGYAAFVTIGILAILGAVSVLLTRKIPA